MDDKQYEHIADYDSEMNDQFREDFLKNYGRTEGDVMEDEAGKYVMVDNDKDESKSMSKEYLPEAGDYKDYI